jgi:hypothetical protein
MFGICQYNNKKGEPNMVEEQKSAYEVVLSIHRKYGGQRNI